MTDPEATPAAALAAAVASAFNDELTLLLNQLAMLLEEVGREDPLAAGLRRAQQATLRCSAITEELIEFSRRSGVLFHVRASHAAPFLALAETMFASRVLSLKQSLGRSFYTHAFHYDHHPGSCKQGKYILRKCDDSVAKGVD